MAVKGNPHSQGGDPTLDAGVVAFEVGHNRFDLVPRWAHLPDGWNLGAQTSVVTHNERVYLFNRGSHPVIVLDADGGFVDSWGEGVFPSAHGSFMTATGDYYVVPHRAHVVQKFDVGGNLLMTLGSYDSASDTGWTKADPVVRQAAAPFNTPTDIAVGPDGDIFVSDGYRNARIHRFSPDGVLKASWGEPGTGRGQFMIPHGIWVHHDGRVYVADRENNRIQVFDGDGAFIREWPANRPCDIAVDSDGLVYIAELSAYISVRTLEGEAVSEWKAPWCAGPIDGGHSVWVDDAGDLYVGQNHAAHRIEKYRRG